MHLLFLILIYIWQLLQNIIAIIIILLFNLKFLHNIKNCKVFEISCMDGMALGNYIFINPKCNEGILLRHEYVHCIQSLYLGPLYLIIIFIPSFIWYTMDQSLENYYNFYTEKWANWLSVKKYKE